MVDLHGRGSILELSVMVLDFNGGHRSIGTIGIPNRGSGNHPGQVPGGHANCEMFATVPCFWNL